MIKTLQLKLVLLLCMIMGAGTAWADEVQLSEGVHDGSAITWTLRDGSTTAVTIKQMKGAGAAVSANYISAPRVYRANLLSFEAASGYAITNISITYSGNYKGTTITSGTELSGDDVTSNTADITQTLSTESNGTHTFASSSSSGLSAIYIQNGTTSATNTQLRPTKIDVTFVSSGGSGTQTVATPSISGNESFVNSTEVTISCSTDGATIQYSTDDGSTWTNYSAPFTLTATTTVQAKATKSGMTESAVASKTFTKITPLANIAALTANTENGTYYVTLNNAVVTFVSGNYAYIQDASGAVAMYKSGHGLTAGDVLNGTATVAYQLRNANPQITDLSGVTSTSGTAPDPTSVAQSAWNYTFGNVLSQYFQITGATITTSNNKYYVSLGGEDVQLYKIGTAISSLDLTKTYTITGFPTLYNTTKELQIFEAPEVEVGTTPTIIASPSSLSGFTYEEGNGPSDAKTISVSGSNLTANITVALTSNSDFELSTNENSGYANSITLTQSSGTVAATTVYVRLKAGLVVANNYSDDITISSTGATDVTVSLAGSVTNAAAPHVTWDLSIDETATASENEMTWTSTYATMGVAKGSASTNTNNYYPGTSGQSYTSTRFYKNSNLTITPASGFAITSVVFTATTSGYATALQTSTWTNATASVDNTTVTVTPTDGNADISAVIGGTCGFTAVTVYYTTSSVVKYDITLSNNVENGSIAADKSKAQENETVTLTATPDANYELDSWTVSYGNSQTVNVTVDGSDANKATFIMPASDVTVSATFVSNVTLYTVNIDSNISNGSVSSDKSTAAENDEVTLTVTPASGYALDVLTVVSGSANVATTKVNSTTYKFTMPAGDVSVSATFAQFTGSTYTLATSLVSGKKYIIVGKDDQNNYYAMGEQRSNNRAGVGVTVNGTTATVSSSDVREFVIGGLAGSYTIFDDVEQGYLYAASSGSNYLRTQADNDENGEWTINFDDTNAEASVVANGTYTRNVMHFNPNNGSPIFSCYASTSTLGPVYFYVKDEAASSVTVTIKANFPATTFSTDKALDFTNVTDATAYIITDGNGTTAKVEKVPANTGLYIEAATIPTSNLEIVVPVYTGSDFDTTTGNLLEPTTGSAVTNTTTDTYYVYGRQNSKYAFFKVPDGGYTPSVNKAVLKVPTGQAKDFIDVNGGATSIDNSQWTIDNSEVNGIYDLQGRRVVAPTKGIYIVNGRKVVIK